MGIIRPSFWTESIGRVLRQHSAETRELAVYLSSCDECDETPYGLYQLDLDKAVMLTGRPMPQVTGCLATLEEIGFLFFHQETKWVFIRDHARQQFGKLPLTLSDMKCRTARLWYRRVDDNPFIGHWWDRYGADFNLAFEPHAVQRREWNTPDQPDAETPGNEFMLVPPEVAAAPFSKAASFERICNVYPGMVSPSRARAVYYRKNVSPVLEAEIIAGIERLAASQDWIKEGGKFIPALHNFLRDERWKDRARSNAVVHLNDRTVGELQAGQRFIDNMTNKGPKR